MKSSLIYLDILFIIMIVSTIVWASVESQMLPILAPIVLILVGLVFIYSKKFKDRSFIEKIFYWISYNVFVPRTKYNHIICGSIFIVLGAFSSIYIPGGKDFATKELAGEDPTIQHYQDWWYKDPILYIIIILIILIGLYRSRK